MFEICGPLFQVYSKPRCHMHNLLKFPSISEKNALKKRAKILFLLRRIIKAEIMVNPINCQLLLGSEIVVFEFKVTLHFDLRK